MTLDRTFQREIAKVANGDGSREAFFAFKKTVRTVARTLSNIEAPYLFDGCVKEYGRVPVAVCVAVTICKKRDGLPRPLFDWAIEVMNAWTNRAGDLHFAFIDDGLHFTRIAEYAGSFIRLTTAEVEK